MKIWQKSDAANEAQNEMVERFTIGNDKLWDLRFAEFDVLGSIAHATMLQEVGIITVEECKAITDELKNLLVEIRKDNFKIDEHTEDVHSQVEEILIKKIGDAGKKLHTGRSRNDQVLVDIKLYLKHELKETAKLIFELFERLQQLSEAHKKDLLPGYTHFQLAMPSSFGLWFGAYAESLVDDTELLKAAFNIADKNPLGSGAGFGSAFPLNRKLTTESLGFADLNYNSVYAQMTRGKTEKAALNALAAVASTLSRFSYDVCFYMTQQLAYISFPDSLTTGSSIMPHKKNPDVFELIRAKCNRIQAAPNEMTLLCNNLPSGYHRDTQLTKDILFPAIDALKDCLEMLLYALKDIRVRENILDDKQFDDLFTVEAINQLVVLGIPFRDAYRQVGKQVQQSNFNPSRQLSHTHEGSIGNLCNQEIREAMLRALSIFNLQDK
jgi:argininosuccinate lyase